MHNGTHAKSVEIRSLQNYSDFTVCENAVVLMEDISVLVASVVNKQSALYIFCRSTISCKKWSNAFNIIDLSSWHICNFPNHSEQNSVDLDKNVLFSNYGTETKSFELTLSLLIRCGAFTNHVLPTVFILLLRHRALYI